MSEAMPFCWIRESIISDRKVMPCSFEYMAAWFDPKSTAGMLPLFLVPAEFIAPQWTKETPSAPGHYWVWQPSDEWPCHGDVMTALVHEVACGEDRPLFAWTPKMNNGWPVLPMKTRDSFWHSALWLGPIPAPAPPTKDQL